MATISIAVATIMFTTPIATQKMKLYADYSLNLYYAEEMGAAPSGTTVWILVPSEGADMDWGEFYEGENKKWYLKVKNVGNVEANVCWQKSGWDDEEGKWTLKVSKYSGGMTYEISEGVTLLVAVGAEQHFMLDITEVAAEPGVVYSFGVLFENHDAPV